ncbi:MAG: M23 family metallopeptidase [Gammaproteobacteria bacterium]|nr:M23 family metallopeptidase [Gammaproteobacteria bacterium]
MELEIKHDETYSTLYVFEPFTTNQTDGQTQLDNILVTPGQTVAQGEHIGNLFTAGAPGTGSHVHFGLLINIPDGGDPTACPEPYFTSSSNVEILQLIQQDEPQQMICN